MKPKIVIPMGDPAGVGPEIIIKTLRDKKVTDMAVCVIVGDLKILKKAMEVTNIQLKVNCITSVSEAKDEYSWLNLFDLNNVVMDEFQWGEVSAMCGKAAFEYIEKSIQLANSGEVDAVTTTPINKEALKAAEIPYIGHTEIFGDLTNTEDPLTMFETHDMRVFFLTRHLSLRCMIDMIKKDRIIDYVVRCKEALECLGVADGTMAIAGLNPHNGEHGLFGDEDILEIEPAVKALQEMGYDVVGPIGADSVFHLCLTGKYNSVLSLYHDQGHIATKTLDFNKTIAVTNGMPILRTSVDHGTAFDIAGKGSVSEISLIEAIAVAEKYAKSFTKAKNK